MRTITKALLVSMFLVLILFSSSCDKTTKPNDVGNANVIAREGFDLMNEEAERLSHLNNISDQDDVMLESKFNEIEAKFDQALDLDADNPMAHLGLSILEILRVNYDPELWTLMDDIQDMGNKKQTLLNNQLEFLSQVPAILLKNYTANSKEVMSIARLQNFIKDYVTPRLENSLTHLNHAINMADSSSIYIDTGEELIEIDLGEIYAFKASVRILNAAFYMLTTYDWDLIGADGTYGWINQMSQNFAPPDFVDGYNPYDYVVENQVLKLYYWDYYDTWDYSEPFHLEIAAKTLKHNLVSNTSFGTLNQSRLTKARTNILGAADDIRNGVEAILNETDDQANDVIKLQYILDLEDEIANQGPDVPPFMQTWNDIDDVIDWLEGIASSGSFTITVGDDIDVNISIAAIFNGGVSNIRNVIPYFHWNEADVSWLEMDSDIYSWNTYSYSFWFEGEYVYIDNLIQVQEIYQWHDVNPGYFTDSSGSQIPNSEFPHFPDYTFGGIFPGMTRAKLLQILDF